MHKLNQMRLGASAGAALVALVTFCGTSLAQESVTPVVYWSAEPVWPGQSAMLQGAGWDERAVIALDRLEDEEKAGETASRGVPLLDSNARSLRFVIPQDWRRGVYRCRLKTQGGQTETLLNAPQPWWFQADAGQEATPGGWLEVFGRCLAIGQPVVELRSGNWTRTLKISLSSPWRLAAAIPADCPTGEYDVRVHNGCGGSRAWASAGKLHVRGRRFSWKEKQFNVADFGAVADDDNDDTAAIGRALQAVAENHGGILNFGPGRYRLSQGLELPPHLLLRGAGTERTHLMWADAEEPPDALLSSTTGELGLEDLSLYAFNYQVGVRVAAPKPAKGQPAIPAAKNVSIRRVRARFTPLSIKGLTPEQETKRRTALGKSSVFQLSADNVQITDCDLAFTRNIGFSVVGSDSVCRGNRVWCESGGWCPVGGGRRMIVEDNTITGVTTGVTRGSDVWFSRNRVSHMYAGFREGFTTDGTFGGGGPIKAAKIDGPVMTLALPAARTEPPHIPAAVRIMEGRGVGQYRRVVSCEGTRLVLSHPWDVVPDETSMLWLANTMEHHLIVGNEWSDTGIAAQLYGSAWDCVVADNTSARSGGFRLIGNWTCGYVQFLGNRITEGLGTVGPEMNAGRSAIHIVGPYTGPRGAELFKGVTTRGVVIRDNRLDNAASIHLRAAIHDVLVEHNVIRETPRGIIADLWLRQDGVLLRGNRMEGVPTALDPPDAGAKYKHRD